MPTEMIEYGCKIKVEVNAIQSEIKIHREPTVPCIGKETGTQGFGTKGRNKHPTGTE